MNGMAARTGTCLLGGVFLLLLLASNANAATVEGVVYDGLTLEAQANSILTINTNPIQTKVSKDGSYSFTVENGAYVLDAEYRERGVVTQRAQRTLLVDKDGTYTVDIILLPEVGMVPSEPLPGEENTPTVLDQLANATGWWVMVVIILTAVSYAVWNVTKHTRRQREHAQPAETMKDEKKNEKEESENVKMKMEGVELDQYAEEVIGHIKRGGNRMTQKELRGMMKIGEAKVSLVVSELESENIIKKIKRGRENILVLTPSGIIHAEKNTTPAAGETTPADRKN